jgi:hypothetical protein
MTYLKTLFNSDEYVCVSADKYGKGVVPVSEIDPAVHTAIQFIALNPLRNQRLDSEVTAYRNFLIEIDSLPLEQQQPYIDLLGMPYSTKVFSGNKSYHYVISLDEPFDNRQDYDHIVHWLLDIVHKADRSAKNPSRFTRYPDVVRPDTKQVQTLMEVKGRVSRVGLLHWLNSHPQYQPRQPSYVSKNSLQIVPGVHGILTHATTTAITQGVDIGSRNQAYFKAACDLYRKGYSEEDAVELLALKAAFTPDFTLDELERTVRSGYKKAKSDLEI